MRRKPSTPRPWSDEEVAYLERARRVLPPVPFAEIAQELGRSTNSVWSKWKDVRDGAKDEAPRIYEAAHRYREILPALNPNTPDSSTPKFAEDEKHLTLIAKANNGKGFPYLNIPPAYRVAA